MNHSDLRDEELMSRVADGRTDLLEKLIRRHAVPLLTFLVRMVGDHHRGEELFQEVFVSVWRKRALYQYPRPFRPWLYTIALNRCRADFRLKTPRPAPLVGEPLLIDAPDAGALLDETARQVAVAVSQLPEQQRAVVALRIWQEMSYAQIAELINCAESTVRSHMSHALATLRLSLRSLAETT